MKKIWSNLFYNINEKLSETRKNPSNSSHSDIKIEIKINKNKLFLFRHQNMLQVKQLLCIWLDDGPFFSPNFKVQNSAFDEWCIFFLLCYTPLQVFLCAGEGCTDNDTNVLHCYHISLAFLTGFLFATHLPERLAPGSFDYIGAQKHWFLSLRRPSVLLTSVFSKSMLQVRTRSDSDEFLDKPFWRNSFLKV